VTFLKGLRTILYVNMMIVDLYTIDVGMDIRTVVTYVCFYLF
jgi:hypothetical protein